MAEKTVAQLGALASFATGDLMPVWPVSGPGPLKKATLGDLKTFFVGTLGTAASENTGTSLHTLPFLDGANTWSALQNFAAGTFAGQLIGGGTTTNNDAAAGVIGEIIRAEVLLGAAPTLSNSVIVNLATISLTAGDWDLSGVGVFSPSGGVAPTSLAAWASTISATLPTTYGDGNLNQMNLPFTAGQIQSLFFGPVRVSLASTTTIYLSCVAFMSGSVKAYGSIRARRVR